MHYRGELDVSVGLAFDQPDAATVVSASEKRKSLASSDGHDLA